MQQHFPQDIINAAQASQATWHIPASITLAQFLVESGAGAHMPGGQASHNPFGIKAAKGQPYVTSRTREVVHGHTVYLDAKFRKFDSFAQAFDSHGKLLALASPYAHARTLLPDPKKFANALTGVYATDPHYGTALIHTMDIYNLYQYDVKA